jgi:hypothetical protein
MLVFFCEAYKALTFRSRGPSYLQDHRRVIPATCVSHQGPVGYTNLMIAPATRTATRCRMVEWTEPLANHGFSQYRRG